MTRKVLISSLTWRSLEMQRNAAPNHPIYLAPDEISAMLRPTRRSGELDIWVMSFGIIADKEKDLKDFALLCKRRGASVSSHEDAFTWLPENPTSLLVAMWRDARSKGAAKIGAAISATNKKEKTAACIAKIKDKWPMPSSEWPTAALLKEAGVSLNTAKAHLGRRPIAQYNYQAKMKRAKRRQEAGRV